MGYLFGKPWLLGGQGLLLDAQREEDLARARKGEAKKSVALGGASTYQLLSDIGQLRRGGRQRNPIEDWLPIDDRRAGDPCRVEPNNAVLIGVGRPGREPDYTQFNKSLHTWIGARLQRCEFSNPLEGHIPSLEACEQRFQLNFKVAQVGGPGDRHEPVTPEPRDWQFLGQSPLTTPQTRPRGSVFRLEISPYLRIRSTTVGVFDSEVCHAIPTSVVLQDDPFAGQSRNYPCCRELKVSYGAFGQPGDALGTPKVDWITGPEVVVLTVEKRRHPAIIADTIRSPT